MTRTLVIAAYVGCLVVALVLSVVSHRRDSAVAPLGEVLDAAMDERAPRVTLLLFWWWLGWHFLVAQTVDPPVDG